MLETQDRRSFLTCFAALFAASLVPRGSMAAKPASRRILVAGGGLAGLHAADLLRSQGHEVLLLEAGERLGGKCHGGLIGEHPYDFGCQAFSKDMPRVKALGARFGLTVAPRPRQKNFFCRGDQVLADKALEPLSRDFDAIEKLGQAQYALVDDEAKRPELASTSVMDWARPHLKDETLAYWHGTFAAEWCDIPENVSLLHYLEYQRGYDAEGEEMDYRFREGLFRAAEGLAAGLEGNYRLRCPLERVTVLEGGVRVRAGGEDFTGDYLVLAIPLTKMRDVVIEGADTGALRGSLVSARNAAVRKILAVYDRPFWGHLPREGTFDLPCGFAIMDNSDTAAKRYSLAIFLGGPAALEPPSKEWILGRIARVLGEEARSPIAYGEHAWLGDEYLCGGYAGNRGPTRAASDAIPAQIAGRIFPAGSEAAKEFPSYAEGALFSAEAAVAGIAKAIHGIL